jgi:hypothetical protein
MILPVSKYVKYDQSLLDSEAMVYGIKIWPNIEILRRLGQYFGKEVNV